MIKYQSTSNYYTTVSDNSISGTYSQVTSIIEVSYTSDRIPDLVKCLGNVVHAPNTVLHGWQLMSVDETTMTFKLPENNNTVEVITEIKRPWYTRWFLPKIKRDVYQMSPVIKLHELLIHVDNIAPEVFTDY